MQKSEVPCPPRPWQRGSFLGGRVSFSHWGVQRSGKSLHHTARTVGHRVEPRDFKHELQLPRGFFCWLGGLGRMLRSTKSGELSWELRRGDPHLISFLSWWKQVFGSCSRCNLSVWLLPFINCVFSNAISPNGGSFFQIWQSFPLN